MSYFDTVFHAVRSDPHTHPLLSKRAEKNTFMYHIRNTRCFLPLLHFSPEMNFEVISYPLLVILSYHPFFGMSISIFAILFRLFPFLPFYFHYFHFRRFISIISIFAILFPLFSFSPFHFDYFHFRRFISIFLLSAGFDNYYEVCYYVNR